MVLWTAVLCRSPLGARAATRTGEQQAAAWLGEVRLPRRITSRTARSSWASAGRGSSTRPAGWKADGCHGQERLSDGRQRSSPALLFPSVRRAAGNRQDVHALGNAQDQRAQQSTMRAWRAVPVQLRLGGRQRQHACAAGDDGLDPRQQDLRRAADQAPCGRQTELHADDLLAAEKRRGILARRYPDRGRRVPHRVQRCLCR